MFKTPSRPKVPRVQLYPRCLDTTLSLPDLGLPAIGQHHTKRHLTVLCLITDGTDSCPAADNEDSSDPPESADSSIPRSA